LTLSRLFSISSIILFILFQDTTKDNEHLQRLARLEYENIQRQKQSEDFKKLETEKHSLESHIRKKKDNLANLKPQLGAILDASKPVQKYLDMPLDQERDQLDLAKYLPAPLFILFSETRAFAKACDSKLESTIQGDLEEAKAEFATNLRRRMATTGDSSVNDEDEEEIKDDDEEDDSKKKKAKMASTKASKSEKLKKLTICHPLKVEVRITLKDGQNCVQLSFAHLTQLEVITVNVKLVLDQECKSFTGDREVLQAGNLLANLLTSPDEGSNCPNPASLYILKKSGLEPSSRLFSDIGSMYQWAQNLAGLKFPELTSEENFNAINAEAGICRPLVEATILAIRERLTSRIYLQKEISLLEKSKLLSVELPIPDGLKNAFPDKISSSIRAWASVGWEQYVALDVTKHLVETGAVTEHDFLFRLQINRDSAASLIALIAVKPDHPNSPPIFCLNLHWNGEYNIHNSENIRVSKKTHIF
jgi:THO complex subunit 5